MILGVGIEGSSHKYGLFADVVEACEVVIALVRATREVCVDLFHALPWSYGALGILIAVEPRIILCKPWVRLRYHPAHGLAEVCEMFTREACRHEPAQFVEGILYARDRGASSSSTFGARTALQRPRLPAQ